MPWTRFRTLVCLTVLFLTTALPARADIIDPTGDTVGIGPVQLDVTRVTAQLTGGNALTFTVHFAGPISPPSLFAPNSVVGFIDIDADRNPATSGNAPWGGVDLIGGNNWINAFVNPPNPGFPPVPGPLVNLGDEYYIDLGSEGFQPGFVDFYETQTNSIVATLPITYGADSLSVGIPLSLLNYQPAVNYGLIIGTFFEPTDRVPNGANPAASNVPEPSSLLLLGVTSVFGLGYLRRRKRAA